MEDLNIEKICSKGSPCEDAELCNSPEICTRAELCSEDSSCISPENTVILSCSALTEYVNEAQRRMGTAFPVVTVDRTFHNEPSDMKDAIKRTIDALPCSVSTVLVSMGFCGGSWDHVSFGRRIVIPRVDDCVSMLLHRDDELHPNLKEPGHLYIYENSPDDFSALTLVRDSSISLGKYSNLSREDVLGYMLGSYHYVDIIDTGMNPCYEEDYVEAAQKEADLINASLGYAEGGLLLLEKLVSGRWDVQFIVANPGEVIKHGSFFE